MVVLQKRMCAVYGKLNGKKLQMIGSGCINRRKGGKECSCAPDCMWVEPMLKGLRYKEGEVLVDMTITLEPHDGSVPMWLFGRLRSSRKLCVGGKPTFVSYTEDGETWRYQGHCIYVDGWCDKDYFPEVNTEVCQVYVSVKRHTEQN